jgi:hypothetical protein
MTEDESWEELEQRLKRQNLTQYLQRAYAEASRFIEENKNDLGTMTLRKAFEIGYRYGYSDGTNPRTK